MTGFLKLISPLVHPLGFGWLLLLVGSLVCVRHGHRRGAITCGTAFVLLWVVCQPWLTESLIGRLERPWVSATIDQAPHAEAIVVLGGGWRPSDRDFASLDLTCCGDRLLAGFELCRLRKANALVVGGDAPEPPEGMRPSSDRIREWFRDWQLGPMDVHTLGPVRTTRDEAIRTRDLMNRQGWTHVILVTSALHMRRAVDTFEKVGVKVHPVACDFQVLRFRNPRTGWKAFPDEEGLALFGVWWHEQLGWLAYRLLGHA